MRRREYIVYQARNMHPLMQVAAALLTVVVLGALFFLGVVFFAVFAGVAMVLGLAMWLRLRWLQWRARQRGPVERMAPGEDTGDAIDGDYIVVRRRED